MSILDHLDGRTSHDSPAARLAELVAELDRLYKCNASVIPFHNWAHIRFVRRMTVEFAQRNGSNVEIAETAALVHDLNHLVEPGSDPAVGEEYRRKILSALGYPDSDVDRVERIVQDAHTNERRKAGTEPSLEAQALSDADTLFKVLPSTPMISGEYIRETGASVTALAGKIIGEQQPMIKRGNYFYDPQARKDYQELVDQNMRHWAQLQKMVASEPAFGQYLIDMSFESDGSSSAG